MNIYIYKDEPYGDLIIKNLKNVYEIKEISNSNNEIDMSKIFDTNIIIL